MSVLIERVKILVPARGIRLSSSERDVILEIGYLAIAADRRLHDEEIAAFGGVAERLRLLLDPPSEMNPAGDLDELLNRFAQNVDRDAIGGRLRDLGGKLGRPELRILAYKLAYGLSLCDLDTSDEEFQFDLDLIDALELSNEEAGRLGDEVNAMLNA